MARLENLLGAQALALSDRLLTADERSRASIAASERAALVTLLAHPDRTTSWLGEVLGLTSSGITRLVARSRGTRHVRWSTPSAPTTVRVRQCATGLAAVGMTVIASTQTAPALAAGVTVADTAAGLAFPPYADIVARHVRRSRRDLAWSTISSGTGWGVTILAALTCCPPTARRRQILAAHRCTATPVKK